jgi:hypothetical protein
MSNVAADTADSTQDLLSDFRSVIRLRINYGEADGRYTAALGVLAAKIEMGGVEPFIHALAAAMIDRQQGSGGDAGVETPSDSPQPEPSPQDPVAIPDSRGLTIISNAYCATEGCGHLGVAHTREDGRCVMRPCPCKRFTLKEEDRP